MSSIRDAESVKKWPVKKLFIPSSSTKTTQSAQPYSPQLPESKELNGKKDDLSHFLISINGMIVIDLPLPGSKGRDLLLKMPPKTELTLARNAIENRPATIHYLKSVIALSIQNALQSEEGAARLHLLYKGLKTWEDQVPSIAEAKLSAYLEKTIHKTLKEHPELVPYPLEYAAQLRPLLPQSAQFVALPAVFLFDHFESLEQLLFKHNVSHQKDLIAGKTVFFVEGISKVSSLGLRHCLFAPLSFLDSNPRKEILQCRLITQFADEGKSLDLYLESDSQSNPLANLRSPRPFVFCTGRDDPPDDLLILLEQAELFTLFEEAPFEAFWKDHGTSAHAYSDRFLIEKSSCMFQLAQIINEEEEPGTIDERKLTLQSQIMYDGQSYFKCSDPEGAIAAAINMATNLVKNGSTETTPFKELKGLLISSDFTEKFFKPISSAEVSKLFFGWFFSRMGTDGKIFSVEQTFWPVKEITPKYLEACFQIIKDKKKIIFSRTLSSLENQLEIWQTLESFMDYPDHFVAVKAILPLLLFQKELMNSKLLHQQQDKLKQFVLQLLSRYHRFFTIKFGEVPVAYGTSLPSIRARYSIKELMCPVKEIADLLKSLIDKPDLFEKCLDLMSEEMSGLLNIEKRNKGMIKSLMPNISGKSSSTSYYYVYTEDICFKTALSYLSIAKTRGIDPYFIETLLQYVRTPFELTAMSFLILSKEVESKFIHPKDKEKMAQALIYFVTVYLQQKNVKAHEENYKNQRDRPYHLNESIQSISGLIAPMVSYIEEMEGSSFDIDPQMTPPDIAERLGDAKEFTSIQVIHAAANNDQFSQALKEGDLFCAVESTRKEAKKTELQMVTQAVEHGSERSCLVSTLTEAFQNSVDAIRGYVKKKPEAPATKTELFFDVRLVDPKDPHLLLELSDHIGMQSLETLLADFLIPNYSKKGKEKEAVGEMGNGSYQMYRDAEMVTLKTRTLDHPSKVYFLRIVPMRDPETHEVIDLNHKCIDITDLTEEEFEGTTLRVLMKKPKICEKSGPDPQVALEIEGVGIRRFISENFSIAQPPLGEKHSLQCALKLPNGKQKPLQEIKKEIPPFHITNAPFSCYKLVHDETPGFVLTDGYPFKSLKTFLVEEKILPNALAEEVACGWCLNLPKGTYAPVQSRTRIQMTQETKDELQNFLLDWIYARSFFNEKSGPSTRYYPHMQAANSNFSQMFPSRRSLSSDSKKDVLTKGDFASLEAFFVHHRHPFLQKSFLEYIENAYTNLVTPLNAAIRIFRMQIDKNLNPANRDSLYPRLVKEYEKECKKILENWKKTLNPAHSYEKLFFNNVLWPWFEKKVVAFINQLPNLNDVIEEHKHLQSSQEREAKEIEKQKALCQIDHVKKYLSVSETVLSHYCLFYFEQTPMKVSSPPKIRFSYTSMDNYAAYYSPGNHEIVVNLTSHSLSDLLKLGQQIARYEPVKDEQLISVSYHRSGSLNHELQHARQGLACTEDPHAHDYNHEGKYVDFEACAASYAKHAHEAGLFVKMGQALKDVVFPTQEALQHLRKIEIELPEIIMDAIVAY